MMKERDPCVSVCIRSVIYLLTFLIIRVFHARARARARRLLPSSYNNNSQLVNPSFHAIRGEKFLAPKFFNFVRRTREKTFEDWRDDNRRVLSSRIPSRPGRKGRPGARLSLRPRAINFTNSLAVARATQKARCDETGLRLGPLIATRSRKYVLLAIRSARKRRVLLRCPARRTRTDIIPSFLRVIAYSSE